MYLCPNEHSFEPFMCLALVLKRQQSFLFQIYFYFLFVHDVGKEGNLNEHQFHSIKGGGEKTTHTDRIGMLFKL